MKRLKFREAIADIYGFAEREPRLPEKKPEDELPIQPFYMNKMLDSLAREKIGALTVSRPFEDHVQWGKTDGALRARLTPNRGLSIERLTTDLKGAPLWITKEVVRVKTNEFIGNEDVVAKEIGQHVKFIAREQIDSAQRDYNQLFALTKMISQQAKTANSLFVFEEIKKVNENNYNIKMSVVGSGVGRIANSGRTHRQSPFTIIDISYDPDRGSLKGILSTIDVQEEGGDWEIDVPYFMGEFAPSQSLEEITKTIIAGLKFI